MVVEPSSPGQMHNLEPAVFFHSFLVAQHQLPEPVAVVQSLADYSAELDVAMWSYLLGSVLPAVALRVLIARLKA